MGIGTSKKGCIGILTGGGDVPGLNPAIRAVTFRAISEGYDVVGLRRGWRGLINIVRDTKYDNSENFLQLTQEIVDRVGRSGGTFLHSSRTNPSRVGRDDVPEHLRGSYSAEKNDLGPQDLGMAGNRVPDSHWRR
jgi:6-phosphofructokinase 1